MRKAVKMRRRPKEKAYIEQVRGQFYSSLAGHAGAVGAGNFITYGASSTPTLVLIDRAGVVRWYHPGSANQAELTSRIRKSCNSEAQADFALQPRASSAAAKPIVILKRLDQRVDCRSPGVQVIQFLTIGSAGGSGGSAFFANIVRLYQMV